MRKVVKAGSILKYGDTIARVKMDGQQEEMDLVIRHDGDGNTRFKVVDTIMPGTQLENYTEIASYFCTTYGDITGNYIIGCIFVYMASSLVLSFMMSRNARMDD